MLAVAVLGVALDRLLTRNLFDREAQVTAEAVRVLANLDLTPQQFRFAAVNRKTQALANLVEHLTSIPEIKQVRIYDASGAIAWAVDGNWNQEQPFANPELAAALKGEVEIDMGVPKARHSVRLLGAGGRLLDVYVPLIDSGGEVYAVFEITKRPATFFRNLSSARRMLWLLALGVGGVLFLMLARIFLHAQRTQMSLYAQKREVEAQLVQAEKLSVVGEMAAAIAHEINNPLGILMGKTHELQTKARDEGCPQVCREDMDLLGRELGRIGEVVRGLLLFARKSEGKAEATDVDAILRETAHFVEPSFARARVAIVPEQHPALPPVLADGNQLKQVFLNLLQNAKDAMPEGGTIRLRAGAENGHVNIEVIDSGVGIPPEIMSRVFDPFFSTKSNGSGSGLGLSVSYGIIKAHGGRIEVSSTVGHGSVFRVVLPTVA